MDKLDGSDLNRSKPIRFISNRGKTHYCTFFRWISCRFCTFLMMIWCRKSQKFRDEADRFRRFNPTDSDQIAKVYGITRQTSPSELIRQVLPNQIGQDRPVCSPTVQNGPGRRKRRKAQNAETQKGAERDILGLFWPI